MNAENYIVLAIGILVGALIVFSAMASVETSKKTSKRVIIYLFRDDQAVLAAAMDVPKPMEKSEQEFIGFSDYRFEMKGIE